MSRFRWLALGAAAGPIIFTLAWLLLGQVSPGYAFPALYVAAHSALVLPIGVLGLGATGPFMNAAFILCGLVLLIGIVGTFQSIPEMSPIARWSGTTLLALSPAGLVVCGIVTIESMFLYFPMRMPLDAHGFDWLLPFASPVHSVGFLLTVASPVLGFLVVALLLRRVQGWRRFGSWLLLASPLTLLLLVLFFATFNLSRVAMGGAEFSLLALGGLTQRALILEVHAWFVGLGWLAFTQRSGEEGAGDDEVRAH